MGRKAPFMAKEAEQRGGEKGGEALKEKSGSRRPRFKLDFIARSLGRNLIQRDGRNQPLERPAGSTKRRGDP